MSDPRREMGRWVGELYSGKRREIHTEGDKIRRLSGKVTRN